MVLGGCRSFLLLVTTLNYPEINNVVKESGFLTLQKQWST